jgi:hypothetical protein
MSVIAKMNVVDDPRAYGENKQLDLQCVCENKLMPGCNEDAKNNHENRSFQKASPSGTARLSVPAEMGFRKGEELYLIFLQQKERPKLEGAVATVSARVVSRTEYGGTTEQFEIANNYRSNYNYETKKSTPKTEEEARDLDAFNLRMSVDNKAASIQLVAGKSDYWIGIYRCSEYTIDQALGMAHA